MTPLGHYWQFVPESPHIHVYIRAYPQEYRPAWQSTRFGFSLQTIGSRNWTVLTEALDRTQEVGGSNSPSSIASKALQTGHIGFCRAIRAGR
jgi:hypothetical protein